MTCIYSASLQMSLHFEHNKDHYCAVQTAGSGHTLTMLHVNIPDVICYILYVIYYMLYVICIPQSNVLVFPIVKKT